MTALVMFAALAVLLVGASLYGWWTDPLVRYRRSMRRLRRMIGDELAPAFRALAVSAAEAARSMSALAETMRRGL